MAAFGGAVRKPCARPEPNPVKPLNDTWEAKVTCRDSWRARTGSTSCCGLCVWNEMLRQEPRRFGQTLVAIGSSEFKAANTRDCDLNSGKTDTPPRQIEENIQRDFTALKTVSRTPSVDPGAKAARVQDRLAQPRQQMRVPGEVRVQVEHEPDRRISLTQAAPERSPTRRPSPHQRRRRRCAGLRLRSRDGHLGNGKRHPNNALGRAVSLPRCDARPSTF